MPDINNLTITIRCCFLMSSTIIGFARVMIDNQILLKEIPIFRSGGNLSVVVATEQVALCPPDVDLTMLNKLVWSFRDVIELAIVEKWKKSKNGTMN